MGGRAEVGAERPDWLASVWATGQNLPTFHSGAWRGKSRGGRRKDRDADRNFCRTNVVFHVAIDFGAIRELPGEETAIADFSKARAECRGIARACPALGHNPLAQCTSRFAHHLPWAAQSGEVFSRLKVGCLQNCSMR